LIGATHKPRFEISVIFGAYLVFSDSFSGKTQFRIGRHENKEKHLVLELFCQSIFSLGN
jgi:hypothetical protein